MSAVKLVSGDYEIDATPQALPDGRYVARAVVTRLTDVAQYVEL